MFGDTFLILKNGIRQATIINKSKVIETTVFDDFPGIAFSLIFNKGKLIFFSDVYFGMHSLERKTYKIRGPGWELPVAFDNSIIINYNGHKNVAISNKISWMAGRLGKIINELFFSTKELQILRGRLLLQELQYFLK